MAIAGRAKRVRDALSDRNELLEILNETMSRAWILFHHNLSQINPSTIFNILLYVL